ncbi:MAG: translation initiation factor 2 [Oscillospiraceae bacterium]|nr:translation initiation factor 2 [Oscillospiraceae bacterium]
MVKGISRQVIVVQNPDPKLFEQAIFILKDEVVAQGVTDEMLLKEAQMAVRGVGQKKRPLYAFGPAWAAGGMAVTALVWALTGLL